MLFMDGVDALQQAVQVDRALPQERQPSRQGRVPAVARGPEEAGRHVRVHSLRLLLNILPIGTFLLDD